MALLNCSVDRSQVGLFIWGKLPGNVQDCEMFIDDILYNASVFITPGSVFGSNGDRFIRISLGSSVDKLKEAYDRIKNYISKK